MEIKFTGDFKRLIPMGYKFSRMFANNYICYHQKDVWIWRKGKDVEIMDLYSKSHLILDYLIQHQFTIPNQFNMVVLNTETSMIEDYDKYKHSDMFFFDKLSEEEMEKFYKRFHKKFIKQETIDCVKQLYELKLIELKNNPNEDK